jgi:hypothetical protein
MFLNDGPALSDDPANAIKFEVDGLPSNMYAQIVRAKDGRWRTQWGKIGERLESLPLLPTPGAALTALREALANHGHSL